MSGNNGAVTRSPPCSGPVWPPSGLVYVAQAGTTQDDPSHRVHCDCSDRSPSVNPYPPSPEKVGRPERLSKRVIPRSAPGKWPHADHPVFVHTPRSCCGPNLTPMSRAGRQRPETRRTEPGKLHLQTDREYAQPNISMRRVIRTTFGIMPVIKDQITTPSAGIMPDMQGDRGTELPDQGASRSPPYHPEAGVFAGVAAEHGAPDQSALLVSTGAH